MEIKKIVEQYLRDHRYDGLCNVNIDIECGCIIDDLMPCGEPEIDCCAGINNPQVAKDYNYDFFICPLAEPPEEEEG